MTRGEDACFICQRDYQNGRTRLGVEAPDQGMVWVDESCKQVIENLSRSEGISEWDAVTVLLRRIETNLFGVSGIFERDK